MRVYDIFGCTETGFVRTNNEDHILMGRFLKNRGGLNLTLDFDDDFLTTSGLLLAVADGVGGINGGVTASRLGLTALDRRFYSVAKEAALETFRRPLETAIWHANRTVLQATERNPTLANMGCTLAGVCLTLTGLWVFSIGDSRVYHYRGRTLNCLTVDDTLAQWSLQVGLADSSSAHGFDRGGTLLNWLGSESCRWRIEKAPPLRGGDKLLICSDGLHGLVAENELAHLLGSNRISSRERGHRLLQRALECGGWDNISLILVSLD